MPLLSPLQPWQQQEDAAGILSSHSSQWLLLLKLPRCTNLYSNRNNKNHDERDTRAHTYRHTWTEADRDRKRQRNKQKKTYRKTIVNYLTSCLWKHSSTKKLELEHLTN